MSTFQTYGSRLRLNSTVVGDGKLREAQLGALLALGAHAARSNDAAQLILPTGVGKTVVAALSPYAMAAERVLVVVPGRLIAEQVREAFADVARFVKWQVLPHTTRAPRVVIAKHRATDENWTDWATSADVVIGTPNVLSPERKGVARMPAHHFDLMIFDEAHHLPATTWTGIYEACEGRAVLLTATPFRNDRQRLPGEIAFAYPLSRAFARGVFGAVEYRPVEPRTGAHDDVVLASAAVGRLKSPEHVAASSRLLVRTDRVEHADELAKVYEAAGTRLAVIDHRTSWKKAQEMKRSVEGGELGGFICVGALTEGFDFPALKIAAYHSPHKTLGPTLQFVGRLTRVGEIEGELLAMRSAVTAETKALYREDVAWRSLLPALVDSAVERERDIRQYVQDASVTGPLKLPPLALTPSRMAHIFRTDQAPDFHADMDEIAGATVVQRIEHDDSQTLAFVTRRIERPRFLRLDTLDAPIHELHVVTWVEKHESLFVTTNTSASLRDILAVVAPGPRRLLTSLELRRLLAGARLERCFSVGTRALQPHSMTSYRTAAGSKTENDITPADALSWELGHAMGRSGEGTFGFSVKKSKIWEPGAADSLYGFRKWCEGHAREITSQEALRQGALDVLSIAEIVTAFPLRPVVALWPTEALAESCSIVLEGEVVIPERVELVPNPASTVDLLTIDLCLDGDVRGQILQGLDGSFADDGRALILQLGESPSAIAGYLDEHPVKVFFGDGSLVEGDRISSLPPAVVALALGVRHAVEWPNTDITKEFGAADEGRRNVAEAASALLSVEAPMVIQDHLAGEIADFIGIKADGVIPEVHLVHCKASSSATTSVRLGDVQELAAQSMRSTMWLVGGASLWTELRRRLSNRAATKVVAGDKGEIEKLFEKWSDDPPMPNWHVWAVQPGVSNAQLDDGREVTTLLTSVHKWCAGAYVDFRLVCSE